MAKRPLRDLPAERRRAAEQYLADRFRFLVTDFGYTDIGALPVVTPDVSVFGYLNTAAGRQVEVSGCDVSGSLHGLVRQVRDGVPVPYTDPEAYLAFWAIASVRAPNRTETINHNLAGSWESAVDGSAQLLRDNRDLLDGTGWIPRAQVLEAFRRQLGVDYPDESAVSPLRRAFAFLLDHGYTLAFDTDTLTPHEYVVAYELRYEKGADTIRIYMPDIRDYDWMITVNEQDMLTFRAGPKELRKAGAALARRLSL